MNFQTEEATAIADAVARFCEQTNGAAFQDSATAAFSRKAWSELGEMGVLELDPALGSGQNEILIAAVKTLGRSGFPGPVAASFFAAALLPADLAASVRTGSAIVALGAMPDMPWGTIADIVLSLDESEASLVEVAEAIPISTLGGEDWARVTPRDAKSLGGWRGLRAFYDLPMAAYLVGASMRLLEETAAYARERQQFGKAIGSFQGVALPLASAATRVKAAEQLLAVVARHRDSNSAHADTLTMVCRVLAGQAARELASTAHQTFGAIGAVAAGPVYSLSRRFRQWGSQTPAEEIPGEAIELAAQGAFALMQASELGPDATQFREDVLQFIVPFAQHQNYLISHNYAQSDAFYRALGARGWLTLGWPAELGGCDDPRLQEFLLWNEIAYAGIARPPQGVGVVAKTIIRYGTSEQKAHWLERIRSHDATFALAYSEPNAGSDLASLSCRATPTDDGFVINGNKCWNSKAHVVSHLWLLARTGEQSDRGRALSLFIVDAATKGVTIRPIEQMDGNVFTEIFFDDVHVPANRLIGRQDDAWRMIGEALADERHIHFGPGRVRSDFKLVVEWAKRSGKDRQAAVRTALAQLALEVLEAEAQSLPLVLGDELTGPEAALNKVTHTRVLQSVARTAMEIGGEEASFSENGIEQLWRQTMTETIGGGTTQIMEGIIARHFLAVNATG